MELAAEAQRAKIASALSLIVFERQGYGSLTLKPQLGVGLRVMLRNGRSEVLALIVKGYTDVEDRGWNSYNIECQLCWRPLT